MDPWREPALFNHPYIPSTALGMYAPMLESWLEIFPASALSLVNYSDMVNRTHATVNRVLKHLGTLLKPGF